MFKHKPAHIILFVFCLLLSACKQEHIKDEWIEETATITVDGFKNGYCLYTLTYDASQSTAINKEGNLIKGPIVLHARNAQKLIDGQKLKIRYMREEPVIFEVLEPIKYEE